MYIKNSVSRFRTTSRGIWHCRRDIGKGKRKREKNVDCLLTASGRRGEL